MTIALPPESEQLARLVAARSGRTPEAVLHDGLTLEARLAGLAPASASALPRRTDLTLARAIAQRIAAQPLLDPRPAHDILDEAWGQPDDRRR